ncbi:uncharacterized protein LOC132936808 [Metopolophium dirhodum]|nr:uncharacterized protein LOC132936808 [Metopolophium dirhodum]
MENRKTEGNFNHESDEEETEDEQGNNLQTVEEDLIEGNCVNDEITKFNSNPVLETSMTSTTVNKNVKPMPKRTKPSKKINFEDELLKSLRSENEATDPDKSFLMSLLPQMKSISEDKKPMLYIELINAIQRVKNNDNTSMYRQGYNQSNFPLGGYSQTVSGPTMYSQPAVIHSSLPTYNHESLQPSFSDSSINLH